MSLWRHVRGGLSVLTHRGKSDRDIADEVEQYYRDAEAALEAEGVRPEDARRRIRRELGSPARVREEVRDFGWENTVAAFFADLRYAARRLRGSPGFTAVAALTLALGIGASTAIFSAVNPVLFASLPYPHPDRVVTIWESHTTGSLSNPSFGTAYGLATRSRSFEALAAVKTWQPTLVGAREPERLEGQRVGAAYFRALGVLPAIGRDLMASEDVPKGPNVVLVSDTIWHRRFGADPAIVGRTIRLDDEAFTVVGVLPAGLENVMAPAAEVWAPLQYDPALPSDGREWGHHVRIAARLRPGVGRAAAESESNAVLKTLARVYGKGYDSSGGAPRAFVVTPLQESVSRDVKPALLAILGAVLLLLVIACVNVTNLLLARGGERRGEFALRLALGAGRGRLIRQMLTESLLLSIVGGALGVALAWAGVRALVALAPPELPRTGAMHLDLAVVAFAVALTTSVGLLVGWFPARKGSQNDPQGRLHAVSRRAAGGLSGLRRTLVVAEIALALVLLVSAGLLWRSLHRILATPPGLRPDNVLTMQVQITGRRYREDAAACRFLARALEEVRRVPGVLEAGWTSQLPLSGDYDVYGVRFEGDPPEQGSPAYRYAVSSGYFEAAGIPLLRGRLLERRDDPAGAPAAALVSRSLARKVFGDRDPIGRRLQFGPADAPWQTIVGVVGDVKQLSLAVSESEALYVTPTHQPWVDPGMSLVVRAQGDPALLAAPIRAAIWSVDKDEPIVRVATMDALIARTDAQRRFALVLFEIFALAALALAAIGIYGILAGSVAERTREIGVRAALGASRRSLLALVTRQGMTLAALGGVLGLAGAAAASRGLVTLLFGVTWLDPATYVGVAALLLTVAAVACLIPAWRAARIDPATALRAE